MTDRKYSDSDEFPRNVVQPRFVTRYGEFQKLQEEIESLIYGYAGTLPTAAVIGVLEIVKQKLIEDRHD